MKDEITLTYAKSHLSEVLDSVENGKKYYIKRNGKTVAVLSSFKPSQPKRNFGQWRGKVKMKIDFDSLPTDIMNAFEGK